VKEMAVLTVKIIEKIWTRTNAGKNKCGYEI
jgi:hypothetical protein